MLRVRFSEKHNQHIVSKNQLKNYYEMEDRIAVEMFLPPSNNYVIVDESEPADICIVGVQHTDNSLLQEDKIYYII
jgi:hypothetical protein